MSRQRARERERPKRDEKKAAVPQVVDTRVSRVCTEQRGLLFHIYIIDIIIIKCSGAKYSSIRSLSVGPSYLLAKRKLEKLYTRQHISRYTPPLALYVVSCARPHNTNTLAKPTHPHTHTLTHRHAYKHQRLREKKQLEIDDGQHYAEFSYAVTKSSTSRLHKI